MSLVNCFEIIILYDKSLIIMSRQEISTEIQLLLDQLPEESLESVLDYLKKLKELDPKKLDSFSTLNKILKEDSNLLKRLAQ